MNFSDDSIQQRIRAAIRAGDFVTLHQLLDEQHDDERKMLINAVIDGSSCLHLAIGTKQAT